MERIYEILRDLRPEFDFHTSNDYIAEGMLDSFDIVSLVTELEEKFGVIIDAMDIIPENFSNAERISELVKKSGGTV